MHTTRLAVSLEEQEDSPLETHSTFLLYFILPLYQGCLDVTSMQAQRRLAKDWNGKSIAHVSLQVIRLHYTQDQKGNIGVWD